MLTECLPITIALSVWLKNSPRVCHYIVQNLYFPAVQFSNTFGYQTNRNVRRFFSPALRQPNIHQSLIFTQSALHNWVINGSYTPGMLLLSLTLMTDAVINSTMGCVYPFSQYCLQFYTQKQYPVFSSLHILFLECPFKHFTDPEHFMRREKT